MPEVNSTRPIDAGPNSPAPSGQASVRIGPGLSSLLQGSKTVLGAEQTQAPSVRATDPSVSRGRVVFWSLVAADVFLLSQAALLVSGKAPPATFMDWIFPFLCVGLGAWLGSLAVLLGSQHGR